MLKAYSLVACLSEKFVAMWPLTGAPLSDGHSLDFTINEKKTQPGGRDVPRFSLSVVPSLPTALSKSTLLLTHSTCMACRTHTFGSLASTLGVTISTKSLKETLAAPSLSTSVSIPRISCFFT